MRLLLVGGGHAMLPTLVHASAWRDVEVTLLNDRPELWYSGMTPEWLGGVYTRSDVTIDLAALCAREGVELVIGRAVRIDREARSVVTEDGRSLSYDVLAIDVGAANPHQPQHGAAIPTKPLHEIEALGAWLDEAPDQPGPVRQLVIVGGGAAGIEVALNVVARPQVQSRVRVIVVGAENRLLPSMPERISHWVMHRLREAGADVRLGVRADSVTEGTVHLDSGESLPADRVLWATGSVGPPLFKDTGLATTREGFARVTQGLQSVTDPRIFVAGDAAAVAGHEDLARIGVHAVKQGPVLCTNLGRTLDALQAGASLAPRFKRFNPYPIAPLVISTGLQTGWFIAGRVALRSRPLLRLKHLVDRRWMAMYSTREPSYTSWVDCRAASDPLISLSDATDRP